MAFRCGIAVSLVGEAEGRKPLNEAREFVAEAPTPQMAMDAALQKLFIGLGVGFPQAKQ